MAVKEGATGTRPDSCVEEPAICQSRYNHTNDFNMLAKRSYGSVRRRKSRYLYLDHAMDRTYEAAERYGLVTETNHSLYILRMGELIFHPLNGFLRKPI